MPATPSPRRSRRHRFDDVDEPLHLTLPTSTPGVQSLRALTPTAPESDDPTEDDTGWRWSSYADADARGPSPVPAWVVTDGDAIDYDRGVLKTGKEADVHLVERVGPDGRTCLLAEKRYRDAAHRLFHRDAGYLEGRRVRRSREMRAIATRTEFGKELIAGQWAIAEFRMLSRLWSAGAAVPYPVQLTGGELLIEFIGDADGTAAPRLAQCRPDRRELLSLWDQCRTALHALALAGYAQGDLSPYNLLVHDGRLVMIDLPQAVDLVANPQAASFLRRDCENITTWFRARGIGDADPTVLERDLRAVLPGPT